MCSVAHYLLVVIKDEASCRKELKVLLRFVLKHQVFQQAEATLHSLYQPVGPPRGQEAWVLPPPLLEEMIVQFRPPASKPCLVVK